MAKNLKVMCQFLDKVFAVTGKFIEKLENFFEWLGTSEAKHPLRVLAVTILLSAMLSSGIFRLHQEEDEEPLWLTDQHLRTVTDWVYSNFPAKYRFESVILKGDDVLTPQGINLMLKIHQDVAQLQGEHFKTSWRDVCSYQPAINTNDLRNKRSTHAVITKDTGGLNEQPAENDSVKTTLTPVPADEGSTETNDYDYYDSYGFRDTFKQSDLDSTVWHDDAFLDDVDPTEILDPQEYCDIVRSLPMECFSVNLAEMWRYEEDEIQRLSKADILKRLNRMKKSPIFGIPTNFTALLGGLKRDRDGRVISAETATIIWIVEVNRTLLTGKERTTGGKVYIADHKTLDWEKRFIKYFKQFQDDEFQVFYQSTFSIEDVTKLDYLTDFAIRMASGYVVVFIFVVSMISYRNRLEQRIFLSISGLLPVGMATFAMAGIGGYLGLLFGKINHSLPFLLLGLGIDDMFVIVQAFDTLPEAKQHLTMPEKIGLALRRSGVSITVTSLTDIGAFLIGSRTEIPTIRSFCVFAAIGILLVYLLQVTFFVACFSLDLSRINSLRDACLPCLKVDELWKVKHEEGLFGRFFRDKYCPFLLKNPVKVIVVVASIGMFSYNLYWLRGLSFQSGIASFVPPNSYLGKYIEADSKYYQTGQRASVYFKGLNYSKDINIVQDIADKLHAESQYIQKVTSWTDDFLPWVNRNQANSTNSSSLEIPTFYDDISLFLFTPQGARYQANFKFEESKKLQCGEAAPQILGSTIDIEHRYMGQQRESESYNGYAHIRQIVRTSAKACEPQCEIYLWAYDYQAWAMTNSLLNEAFWSFTGTMICIFVLIFLLLASIPVSLLVFSTVLITIIDVAGTMHFWGVTLNPTTVLCLILGSGLCVDYSSHVGHTFLSIPGDKRFRTKETLALIGPPVFNGAASTFLGFCFTYGSDNVATAPFFKVFSAVTILGVFHGLCLLPVLLSTFGPPPHHHVQEDQEKNGDIRVVVNHLAQQQQPALQAAESGPGETRRTTDI